MFKMLIRIWDILFFLFSDYPKSILGENGNSPQGICFLLNCSWYSKEKRIFISIAFCDFALWNFDSENFGLVFPKFSFFEAKWSV